MTTINIYTDADTVQSKVSSVRNGQTNQSRVIGKTATGTQAKSTPARAPKYKAGANVKKELSHGRWVNYTNPVTASAAIASRIFKKNTKVGKFARRLKFR